MVLCHYTVSDKLAENAVFMILLYIWSISVPRILCLFLLIISNFLKIVFGFLRNSEYFCGLNR